MKLLKKILFFSIFMGILNLSIVNAIPNPAAVYCKELGYGYKIVKTELGEKGVCVLPGKECEEWEFFKGICGQEYSYCAKHGYNIKTKTDGKNPYSPSYSVCVHAKGKDKGKEIGSINNLMNLDEILKESKLIIEGGSIVSEEESTSITTSEETSELPSSFDWRHKDGQNWLTPVKDQGGCGSCWAFAAIGAVEAKIKIAFNIPNYDEDLSEQDLVSCAFPRGYFAPEPEWGGCGGGPPSGALDYVKNSGVTDESCFLYSATDESCSNRCSDWNERLRKIDSSWFVPYQSDSKYYLTGKGPLVAILTMSGYWDGDIYRCSEIDDSKSHAVVIVGYNDAGGYWIAKNSWGTYFGEDGYFKIGYGECDIAIRDYADIFTPRCLGPISCPSYIDPDSCTNAGCNWYNPVPEQWYSSCYSGETPFFCCFNDSTGFHWRENLCQNGEIIYGPESCSLYTACPTACSTNGLTGGVNRDIECCCGSETTNIIVSEDSWAKQYYPDTNYGSYPVFTAGVIGNDRNRIWLKFDLSSLPSGIDIIDAKIWLWGSEFSVGEVNDRIAVAFSSDDSWSESTMTWNNQPTYGSTLTKSVVEAWDHWEFWVVTSAVKNEYTGDKTVTLVLYEEPETIESPNDLCLFYQKEADEVHDPYLEVTYTLPTTTTTIRRRGGGGRPPLMMDILDVLKQPIVIIAILGIIVVIFGLMQFFAKK